MTTTHTPPAPYGSGHIKEMPALASRPDPATAAMQALQAVADEATAIVRQYVPESADVYIYAQSGGNLHFVATRLNADGLHKNWLAVPMPSPDDWRGQVEKAAQNQALADLLA